MLIYKMDSAKNQILSNVLSFLQRKCVKTISMEKSSKCAFKVYLILLKILIVVDC